MSSIYNIIFKFYLNLLSIYAKCQRIFLGTRAFLPVRTYIFLSDNCNCSCYFCAWGGAGTSAFGIAKVPCKDELSFEHLKGLIDQLPHGSVITFTGGEPTLAKDFIKIIQHSAKAHKVQIMTNGTTLNQDKIEKLVNAGVWIINFSIDAPVAMLHDKIRGHDGLFHKITESIKEIKEIKQKRNLKRPFIHVNTVVLKESVPYLPDMVKLCAQLKVDWLSFAAIRDGKGISVYGHSDLLDLKEKLKSSIELARDAKLSLRIGEEFKSIEDISKSNQKEPGNNMSGFVCYAPWTTLKISPDGTARICHIILGNIKEDSLENLWNNKMARDLRTNFCLGRKELPQECQGCCLLSKR